MRMEKIKEVIVVEGKTDTAIIKKLFLELLTSLFLLAMILFMKMVIILMKEHLIKQN